MSEIPPQGTIPAGSDAAGTYPPNAYPPSAYAQGVPAELTQAPPATWRRWLLLTAVVGVAVGVLWWLAAPGGAFYGSGKDYTIWFGRDLVLASLGVLAGLGTAVLLLRAAAKPGGEEHSTARFLAATAGALLGSAVAWRVGVFAGDLFQTPPANMANPSIVFSLRSASVMLVWPLVTAGVVFLYRLVAALLRPTRADN